jgi:hypothetical protein
MKPIGAPPKCVNCGGDHPAKFTGCPQYLQQLNFTQQIKYQQQRQARSPKTTKSTFQYQ